MCTRDDDILDSFAGAVGDVDVHFDELAVVEHLEGRRRSEKLCSDSYSLFTVTVVCYRFSI